MEALTYENDMLTDVIILHLNINKLPSYITYLHINRRT